MFSLKYQGFLFSLVLLSIISTVTLDSNLYNGTSSVFIPYSNARSNAQLDSSPRIYMGFNGNVHYHSFVMDTGSVGIIASEDIFKPARDAVNLGPGEQYYSSSGIIEKGTWWSATQQFYDAEGKLLAVTNVPVLQVTSVSCAKDARYCSSKRHPRGIVMMGVGFSRESAQQPRGTPEYNPFLNIQMILHEGLLKSVPKDWCNGYIVTQHGVHLGLTAQNTSRAALVKLMSRPEFSNAKLKEWMPATMTIKVNGKSGNGNILLDTGVGVAFLTPPAYAEIGPLAKCPRTGKASCAPNGTEISVFLPNETNPVAHYSFKVGQEGNPMRPEYVTIVRKTDKVFFNTSRRILRGIDFLYDNTNGYVGYIWNGGVNNAVGDVRH